MSNVKGPQEQRCDQTAAFSVPAKTTAARSTVDASASVRLETERWVTDDPDEAAGSSYGPIGSLYRAGPRPFLPRIFDADTPVEDIRCGHIRVRTRSPTFEVIGPSKILIQLHSPTKRSQAVLKYMASEGCDRKEAQGNMDAFLDNPQDWGYQKVQEKEAGAFKKDYANANMDPKSVILSTVWAAGVVYFFGDLALKLTRGEIMADSFHRTMKLLGVE